MQRRDYFEENFSTVFWADWQEKEISNKMILQIEKRLAKTCLL